MASNSKKKKFMWDVTTIITALSFAAGIIGFFFKIQNTQTIHESRIDDLSTEQIEIKKELEKQNAMQDANFLRFEQESNARFIRQDNRIDMVCKK